MCRRRKLTSFTNNAFVVRSELGGKKWLPMKKCWDVLVSPLCTLSSASASLVMIACSENGRRAKSLLYSKLVVDRRNHGRPTLHFNDVCKHENTWMSAIMTIYWLFISTLSFNNFLVWTKYSSSFCLKYVTFMN